ncbi:hypothetical protein FRB98_000672 [Tulasnella sp. 332]|nr:hypothetical protein FRB98_000672 [Tulasnella sp. 332]
MALEFQANLWLLRTKKGTLYVNGPVVNTLRDLSIVFTCVIRISFIPPIIVGFALLIQPTLGYQLGASDQQTLLLLYSGNPRRGAFSIDTHTDTSFVPPAVNVSNA